jgi:hypothetical protein
VLPACWSSGCESESDPFAGFMLHMIRRLACHIAILIAVKIG